jgi:hypothetical protein
MTLNVNQFAQSQVQGRQDLRQPGQAMSVQVDPASAGGLVPGQAVKLSDIAGNVPQVIEAAADSDAIFGFILFSPIKNVYGALDMMEILVGHDGVMYMTSSAAIARGASVMVVIAGQLVATATTGKRVIGIMLDKPTGAGVLCRVMLNLPGILAP